MKSTLKFLPKYDQGFKPAYFEIEDFEKKVKKSGQENEIIISIERYNRYNCQNKALIYKDSTGHDEENYEYIEHIIKTLLWIVGGNKIYITGSPIIAKRIQDDYKENGKRGFDVKFFTKVYEGKFEVISCEKKELPVPKIENIIIGKRLNGCRIGFDAGGSDRKVSAFANGKETFSDETIWNPKTTSDPKYFYDNIMDSLYRACAKLPTVDGIGVSTAGIVIDNKIMVSSLYNNVSEEDYFKYIKNIYINCIEEIEKNYNKKIAFSIANDGDVAALAGSLSLNLKEGILGISMGTSQAGGYISPEGSLLGWINELAFVPVDYNKKAMVDEWSGDYGCGVKYFSQDSVIKLAETAGIKLNSENTPAEKLKFVQNLLEKGNETEKEIVKNIYLDIGSYLGYSIPLYSKFYDFKHLVLFGRVVSGNGGNLILNRANEVLEKEFPELAKKVIIHLPDDKSRRIGQSAAAASLPEIK